MNPHLLRRRSGLTYLTFFGMVLFGGSAAASRNYAPQLLRIADLTSKSYQITSNTSTPSVAQYQSLEKAFKLPEIYSRVSHAAVKYQEPILTRGASGIAVFRTASPAVVLIFVGDVKKDQFEPSGLGSGVVIDSRGDILTNWHVINGYSAAVIFFKPEGSADPANSRAYVAEVVGQSEVSDLALLHLTEAPPSKASIPIGNISSVQVAEDIHVIGHPEGNPWSYSTGVVSQVRDDYAWTYVDGSKHEAKVLQLQTAISPGNSGGPVLDDQGRLLGLIAMSQEGQNLDYAVAADVIQRFISSVPAAR